MITFRVYAGNMYVGLLLAGPNVHVFETCSGRCYSAIAQPNPQLRSYKKLTLRRVKP